MPTSRRAPPTIEQTAATIGRHRWVEEALFALTGAWSVDPATGAGAAAAEIRTFLATQSALHAWRAQQWAARSPSAVRPEIVAPHRGWTAAVERAEGIEGATARLACWSHALQPALIARYRNQSDRLAMAADAGHARWLRIAVDDALDGLGAGVELLVRRSASQDASPVSAAAGAVLAEILST